MDNFESSEKEKLILDVLKELSEEEVEQILNYLKNIAIKKAHNNI